MKLLESLILSHEIIFFGLYWIFGFSVVFAPNIDSSVVECVALEDLIFGLHIGVFPDLP